VAAFTERVVSQVPEPICRWPLIFTIPKVLQMLVGEHRLSPEFAVGLDNSLVAPGVCTLLHLYGRRRAPAQLRVAAPALQPCTASPFTSEKSSMTEPPGLRRRRGGAWGDL
jgi:hypothetical protein